MLYLSKLLVLSDREVSPIHFILEAHCCPLVLIEVACHIWKYYIIKCYKMLVIFTYNDRHYVIYMKITQYCYSLDCCIDLHMPNPVNDVSLYLSLHSVLSTSQMTSPCIYYWTVFYQTVKWHFPVSITAQCHTNRSNDISMVLSLHSVISTSRMTSPSIYHCTVSYQPVEWCLPVSISAQWHIIRSNYISLYLSTVSYQPVKWRLPLSITAQCLIKQLNDVFLYLSLHNVISTEWMTSPCIYICTVS